jgi:hypothetical protein
VSTHRSRGSYLILYHVTTRTLLSALRDSRILTPILRDFSRRDPEASCHLYSTRWSRYGPHYPPTIGISPLAISRSLHPNSWAFSCETPIHDPTCGSNGPPTIWIQWLSPSRFSRPRDFEYPIFGLLPCELPSSRDHRYLPPVLLRWTAPIFSPLRTQHLGSQPRTDLEMDGSCPATSPHDLGYLGFQPANSRVREITDLCHLSSSDGRLLSSRNFATRDLEYPILGFSTCELPSSRDHRSLPPVLYRWMVLILSGYHVSRYRCSCCTTLGLQLMSP